MKKPIISRGLERLFWIIIVGLVAYGISWLPQSQENMSTGDSISIQTYGQQGGAVVGKTESVIINEAPKTKPWRKLNESTKNMLLQRLDVHKGKAIKITYLNQDEEAYNYAKQIKEFLEKSGWNVASFSSAMIFSKKPRHGVNVDTKESEHIGITVYKQ